MSKTRALILWTLAAVASAAVAIYALHYLLPHPAIPPNIAGNRFVRPWLAVHAGFAAVALLVGPSQFLTRNLRKPSLHRWLGRAYAFACVIGGIAGFVLAFGATAGPIAGAGFAALAILWVVTTAVGWRAARDRRFADHRRWMIRSFSLAFAAVTLRIYLPLALLAGFPAVPNYRAIAWLCWIPNLLAVEWYFARRSAVRSIVRSQPEAA